MVQITENSAPLASRLTEEQRLELARPVASDNGEFHDTAWASTHERTRIFHQQVGLPVENKIVLNPSVSLRELRLRLILEEFLETVKAFGFKLKIDALDPSDPDLYESDKETLKPGFEYNGDVDAVMQIGLEHIEGSKYDVVEAADGLADLDVVINGAMLSLGIPAREVGYEVYCSNMSKLDENGNPIVNQCQYPGDENCKFSIMDIHGPCVESAHYQRPDLPHGKVLKPDSYVKANVSAVLVNYANAYGTKEI